MSSSSPQTAGGGVIDLSIDSDSDSYSSESPPTRKRGLLTLTPRKVIVLDDDDDDDDDDDAMSPNLKPPSLSPNSLASTGRGQQRQQRHLDEEEIDDDVEIISPSTSAAAAAAATTKLKSSDAKLSGDEYWIESIREAFPYYPRAEIATYLSTARSYVLTTVEEGDDIDECTFRTVMTVLAEEGIKPSASMIPAVRFATVAIGGRVEISDNNFSSAAAAAAAAAASSSSSRRKTALLECQCCFVEYDFTVMVPCRSGHLFCMECLRKHTEQRVFGNGNFGSVGVQQQQQLGKSSEDDKNKALELLCLASDCVSGFDDRVLKKALPEKVFDQYEELRFKANLECANMDVSTCPKCNFKAAFEHNHSELNLFNCPECRFKSCLLCHEEYHPNIASCDLVESQTESSGRNKVEEAMTASLIRICPQSNCRKKFLKTYGCNKMKCPCGCFVCNICRVEIPAGVGYTHFCST
jgi:hypothetical protein